MRFFPSGFCTIGCSLDVVNVYTKPVSDTTSSRTCVPVRILSSYAYCVVSILTLGLSEWSKAQTDLLHDTRFTFRKRDMSPRLVANVLDSDLSPSGFPILVYIRETAGDIRLSSPLVARTVRCFCQTVSTW